MKKFSALTTALLLAAALCLAGCAEEPAPSSSENAFVAAIESQFGSQPLDLNDLLPTDGAAPDTDYLYTQEATDKFNEVLAKFADGTFPAEIYYHTEGGGFSIAPPPDAVLPQSVQPGEVDYAMEYSEMWGVDYLTLTMQVEGGYTMEVEIQTDADNGKGKPTTAVRARFVDNNGTQTADNLPAESGGSFANVTDDRVSAYADFEKLQPTGAKSELTGNISWWKGNPFIWIYINTADGGMYMYTYDVSTDGSLVQEYPTDQYRSLNPTPYTDEEFLVIADSIFSQFKAALEAAGMPA